MIAAIPEETGGAASVDESRIGLFGQSAGGGGVLYAAGSTCRDRIKACIALDPGIVAGW